jgi:hypothetical protein
LLNFKLSRTSFPNQRQSLSKHFLHLYKLISFIYLRQWAKKRKTGLPDPHKKEKGQTWPLAVSKRNNFSNGEKGYLMKGQIFKEN